MERKHAGKTKRVLVSFNDRDEWYPICVFRPVGEITGMPHNHDTDLFRPDL
jgi:hypothetical protein